MTYQEAILILRGKDQKKIRNNTILFHIDEDTVGIRLHKTVVVKISKDNRYTLNSGGWHSSTTKERLNRYTPVRVYQKRYQWYIGNQPFYDGIEVSSTGKILSPVK